MIGAATSPTGEVADFLTFYSPENYMGLGGRINRRPMDIFTIESRR